MRLLTYTAHGVSSFGVLTSDGEGVIDLAFREGDHWVVADYKTDSGDDPDFEERSGRYRAQVDLYAECWEELTGEAVGERVLVYTAQGRTESW